MLTLNSAELFEVKELFAGVGSCQVNEGAAAHETEHKNKTNKLFNKKLDQKTGFNLFFLLDLNLFKGTIFFNHLIYKNTRLKKEFS